MDKGLKRGRDGGLRNEREKESGGTPKLDEEGKRYLRRGPPIVVDVEKCTGCELCALYCCLVWKEEVNPRTARIRIQSPVSGPPEIHFTDECNLCGLCVKVCSYGALTPGKKNFKK